MPQIRWGFGDNHHTMLLIFYKNQRCGCKTSANENPQHIFSQRTDKIILKIEPRHEKTSFYTYGKSGPGPLFSLLPFLSKSEIPSSLFLRNGRNKTFEMWCSRIWFYTNFGIRILSCVIRKSIFHIYENKDADHPVQLISTFVCYIVQSLLILTS